ncbi:hypothetical protein HZC09_04905 [Candidatus Micrarchaeota archaeon]|nr:hypothetical protein [Candidatus Micrarchaeota archaeon]
MNLRITLKALGIYVSVAMVLYGMSGYLAKTFSFDASLLADAWKMIALAVGLAFITGFVYPHLRAVRHGDQLMVFANRQLVVGGIQQNMMDLLFVTALEDGKRGQKIKFAFGNGMQGEGVITSYSGTFTPGMLKVTETERME